MTIRAIGDTVYLEASLVPQEDVFYLMHFKSNKMSKFQTILPETEVRERMNTFRFKCPKTSASHHSV